jgi:hypothetical protein
VVHYENRQKRAVRPPAREGDGVNRKLWLTFGVGLLLGMCFGGVRCSLKVNQQPSDLTRPCKG